MSGSQKARIFGRSLFSDSQLFTAHVAVSSRACRRHRRQNFVVTSTATCRYNNESNTLGKDNNFRDTATRDSLSSPEGKKSKRQHRGRSILERPGVLRVEHTSQEDVVHHLASQIVYQKGVAVFIEKGRNVVVKLRLDHFPAGDGIIGLNKPAGLGIHSASNQDSRNAVNLHDLLPRLSELLGEQHIHFVKAPERECSGVTILATGPGIAAEIDQSLKKARRQSILTRRYWAVTVGVPKPLKGVIDVAIAEQLSGGLQMVVVKKDPSKQSISKGHTKKTLTQYRVLDHNSHCALVELQPLKAYRHHLQVHMTTKLCSILGDHLYSSRVQSVLGVPVLADAENTSPATQVPSREILHKMNLTSSMMSSIPLHLHCAAVCLPNWRKGADITICAPMPKYFWKTLKLLDLWRPTSEV